MKTGRTHELVEWAVDAINTDGTAQVLIATSTLATGRHMLDEIGRRLSGRDLRRRNQNEIAFEAGGTVRIVSTDNASRGRRCDLLLLDADAPEELRYAAIPTEWPR